MFNFVLFGTLRVTNLTFYKTVALKRKCLQRLVHKKKKNNNFKECKRKKNYNRNSVILLGLETSNFVWVLLILKKLKFKRAKGVVSVLWKF